MTNKLKVWWIPQMPMKAFEVEVDNLETGVKIMDVLARYDAFQFAENIKPDYCNTGGIVMLEDDEWVDWYDDYSGEDDPAVFLSNQKDMVK